jgi:hypothetical protein
VTLSRNAPSIVQAPPHALDRVIAVVVDAKLADTE